MLKSVQCCVMEQESQVSGRWFRVHLQDSGISFLQVFDYLFGLWRSHLEKEHVHRSYLLYRNVSESQLTRFGSPKFMCVGLGGRAGHPYRCQTQLIEISINKTDFEIYVEYTFK